MPYKDPKVRRAYDRERFRKRVAQRTAAGLCTKCGKRPPEPERSICAPCAERARAAGRARDARLRAAGLGLRFASLARALRASPVTASPSGGRSNIRTVAANRVGPSAGAAIAASARVLRTTARGSVGTAGLGQCNRHSTLAADAAVTCASRTSAYAVTSERRPHRQQHRHCLRSLVRCGNMCNASRGCIEHVRRNACAEGTAASPGAPCVMNRAAHFRCAPRSVTLIPCVAGVSGDGGMHGGFAQFRLHSEFCRHTPRQQLPSTVNRAPPAWPEIVF